jgi:acetyl-CoA carboxylase, biotin carboxylase subunit
VDLVQWQLRIAGASGWSSPRRTSGGRGHAIECRITSEDPWNGFLPSSGTDRAAAPPGGPGVRWDGGVQEGDEVSLFYDPMLAKLVVHAPTRELAIERGCSGPSTSSVVGVETSAPFHRRVLLEPDFRAARIDIRYLDQHPELLTRSPSSATMSACVVAAALLAEEDRQRRALRRVAPATANTSRWRDMGWR